MALYCNYKTSCNNSTASGELQPSLAHNTGTTPYPIFFLMSTIPSTPGASPSRPSHPHPRPVVAIPTQPHAEEEDPEIAALTKKISALREKRAQEEEEKKVWEAAEKVRREE